MSEIRRARSWLGTLVEIRVRGVDEARAKRAVEAAFAEVAIVHRLMSFHARDSDLSRLRQAPVGACVRVNARTHEVLQWSLRIAAATAGAFDPTIAMRQVACAVLPVPESPFVPDAQASWRDIELLAGERVRLSKPAWIDLGGIAKGYAVDRAIEVLQAHGVERACVNAGGDLRVCGPRAEAVAVRSADGTLFPALELCNGAVATSSTMDGRHLHGATKAALCDGATASVAAPRCVIADALTKAVLANTEAARTALPMFDAQAWRHDSLGGWQSLVCCPTSDLMKAPADFCDGQGAATSHSGTMARSRNAASREKTRRIREYICGTAY